jgi:Protein of unknown function (DUF3828)
MMFLLFLAAAAAQPQADTPRAFLERTYASYKNPDFNPISHPDRYFAPPLLAAMNEDSRLAHGEVGYVDGDPICQCQDPAGMHASVVKVTPQGRNKAIVQVSIGWDHDKPRPTQFSLVRTRAGWRIADVSSADEPSFLRAIEESNRKQRASQKRR